MLVRDLDAWQGQRAEIVGSGAVGEAFLAFLEDWAELAERKAMVESDPARELNRTLAVIEATHGRTDFLMVGQMLGVLIQYWVHGVTLRDELSPIERRLVEDVITLKIAHEMKKAEETTQ